MNAITGKIDMIFMGGNSFQQAYVKVKLKESTSEASICNYITKYYKYILVIDPQNELDHIIYEAMLLAKEKNMKISLYHSSCESGRALITGFKLW